MKPCISYRFSISSETPESGAWAELDLYPFREFKRTLVWGVLQIS